MNGTKNQGAAPSAITPETLAAFDRMRATLAEESRRARAAVDAVAARLERERARVEMQRIAALCEEVEILWLEVEMLRAWPWTGGARELPS